MVLLSNHYNRTNWVHVSEYTHNPTWKQTSTVNWKRGNLHLTPFYFFRIQRPFYQPYQNCYPVTIWDSMERECNNTNGKWQLPSPSSLKEFGWETAKHCIVSYFWCASWLSWPSSESARGFTSIRQLKVWLLRLGVSPDQDPPFTEQSKDHTVR